ncbi:MAG: metallophosphoesterase family protein [Methylovulum sp.]|nr:metallophosphoesterase family protein [Methylovulum sp.]
MRTIDIIGSIDGQPHYDTAYLDSLLSTDLQSLIGGTAFMGRPGTLLHVNQEDVLKIRSDLEFSGDDARAWLQKTLQNERRMAVHHPYKTWLLITDARMHSIASVCPRLKPLHIELMSAADRQRNLALLTDAFRLYLTLARRTGEKLDEGLSNFAVSSDGQVYYLDDEYYAWDDFVAFSIMLGVLIRHFTWLDDAFIDDLGQHLRQLLQDIFHDGECVRIVCAHLQPLFMPNAHKEHLLKRLVRVLLQPSPASLTMEAAANMAKPKPPGRFFALLADIHANYSALSCVLDYLKDEQIDEGIVLGDIVGYGPQPKECIERLQASPFQVIKGNHDHGIATGNTSFCFSKEAGAVAKWTIGQLSAQHLAWLDALPLYIRQENWYAVHGAPMDENYFYAYVYLMTYQDNLDYMQAHDMALCFHGHSHIPGVFARNRGHDVYLTNQAVKLSPYQQALVCPGSVGQPRNGCTKTQFAIYDRQQRQVNFMQLSYDNESVATKMRDHQLPETLSLRLLKGL